MAEVDQRGAPPGVTARLVIVPHTHWDREWYRPFQDFRYRLVRLLDRLLDILERDEAFSHFHLDGQTIVLEDYLEIRPHQRPRLQRLISAGRLAVGPWYVLPDEFLVSGESIIRNLQIGRSIAARFGTALDVGYLPDQFGHIGQMPQILRGFGIDTAVVWRGVGADVQQTEFRWTSLDGSSVFAVYLPQGYSNGRALPSTAASLRQRLESILVELQPFRHIPSALVMNGTDHQEAQRVLPSILGEALRGVEGVTAKIGSLRDYVDAARREADSLPEHRGELRSPLRAHLLPGVTSMRVRQKQRDFQNVSRLERYAEPLATWASFIDRQRDLTEFVDWAWKVSVQNHPHDSICGCSVDQVHRDMEYRFDQVDMVLRETIRQSFAAIAEKTDTSGEGELRLLVFNPNPAGVGVVDDKLYLDASEALSLVADDGSSIPLWVEPGPSETLLDTELGPSDLRPHVEAIQGREFFGLVLNGIGFRHEGDVLEVAVTADRQARGRFDVAAARTRWLQHLDEPGLRSVRVCARTASLSRLVFVAPLNGHGFTQLGVRRQSAASAPPFATTEGSIENRWYRVTMGDDGSLAILDKELGLELPRCNWFVDEGDRGDEYNFDPVPASVAIGAPSRPAVAHVDGGNAVVARMKVETVYPVPRRLDTDRAARSERYVDLPISTTVSLYAGMKRIDFETEVDNTAEDHRLRVGFQTPLSVDSAFMEQAFGTVERPLDLEPGGSVEAPIGTVPQKTFSALCDGSARRRPLQSRYPRDRSAPRQHRLRSVDDVGAKRRLAVARRPAAAQRSRRTRDGDTGSTEPGTAPLRVCVDDLRGTYRLRGGRRQGPRLCLPAGGNSHRRPFGPAASRREPGALRQPARGDIGRHPRRARGPDCDPLLQRIRRRAARIAHLPRCRPRTYGRPSRCGSWHRNPLSRRFGTRHSATLRDRHLRGCASGRRSSCRRAVMPPRALRPLRELLSGIEVVAIRGSADVQVGGIRADSRAVAPGDVFVCLPGYRTEGGEMRADRHDFISAALERGAAALVVERERRCRSPARGGGARRRLLGAHRRHGLRLLRQSVERAADGRRDRDQRARPRPRTSSSRCWRPPVIARRASAPIEYRFGDRSWPALQTTPGGAGAAAPAARRPSTRGSHAVVMEVSSHALELRRVGGIAFDVAVFTNLSQDHLNFHPDMHHYLRAKGRLFEELASGGKRGHRGGQRRRPRERATSSRSTAVALLTYGVGRRRRRQARARRAALARARASWRTRRRRTSPVELRAPRRLQRSQRPGRRCRGHRHGRAARAQIRDGLAAAPPVPGRFELVDCGQDFAVAVDYAHKPDALERLLQQRARR